MHSVVFDPKSILNFVNVSAMVLKFNDSIRKKGRDNL